MCRSSPLSLHPFLAHAQAPPSVWRLYAAQHLAANQAMVALLSTPAAPQPKPAAKPAAPASSPPGSPASVLHPARTPSRGVSKEFVARRLVALIRTPSVASTDSASDSVASHPVDAADAAEPARRGRSPARAALPLVAALVPVVVAAVAGRARSGRPARRAGSPAARRTSIDRFPEPREVPFKAGAQRA